jgi:DNA-binding CsgD family transcriptional regulator
MSVEAYLMMTNVAPEDWCARVDQSPRMIGRSSEAGIRIPAKFKRVSRKHAEIWSNDPETFRLRDLGSTSGTTVNGVWIEPGQSVGLILGDRLWLGEVELVLSAALTPTSYLVADADIRFQYSDDECTLPSRGTFASNRSCLQQLTPAELDIVLWICRGYVRDVDLGRMLSRRANTIRTQIGSIFRKLNIHSRAELSSWLKRSGAKLTTLEPPSE